MPAKAQNTMESVIPWKITDQYVLIFVIGIPMVPAYTLVIREDKMYPRVAPTNAPSTPMTSAKDR